MALPPGFLDELRSRITLSALVGRRVRLTRRGREHGGLCPFHNEKTPSFYVVDDKNFFHCFGCGAHGDAIGFVMRADNLDFVEAVEKLAGEAGLAVPQATPQERERAQRQKTLAEALSAAAAFYEARLWSPAGRPALDYLHGRGLDDETIHRFRLGWAPDGIHGGDRQALRRALAGDFPEALAVEAGLLRQPEGGDPYDYFRGRVMFPIGDRAGRTIAFGGRVLGDGQPKYLNSPDTPLFEKGRVLYAWSAARANAAREAEAGGPGAIVTEGYMDVIALHGAGFTTAVAPLGTALTEAQLGELWRLAPEPVLCFDGDAAGQRAALRALHRALPLLRPGYSLRFATLPAGEDPDSLIRRAGATAFGEILAAAQPLSAVLWRAQLAARPADTPERRADLERRLTDEIGLIADGAVRAEYQRFARDRLFAAARAERPPRRGAAAQRRSTFVNDGPPGAPPRAPGRDEREILLATLLRHPDLLGEFSEQLVALDFPEAALDRLAKELLSVGMDSRGLDAEALRQHLADSECAETVAGLRRSCGRVVPSAGGDDPEMARRRLAATFQFLLGQDRSDLAAAEQALRAELSEENWHRLQAAIDERDRDADDATAAGW